MQNKTKLKKIKKLLDLFKNYNVEKALILK